MDRVMDEFTAHMAEFIDKVTEFIPDFLVMLVILAAGFVTAMLARFILVRFFRAVRFDAWSDRVGLASLLTKSGIKTPPDVFIVRFIYWLIVTIFLVTGMASLGRQITSSLASDFFSYLPRFISALLILVFGSIASGFLSRAALLACVNAGIGHARLVGETVRLLALLFVFSVALVQLEIAPALIIAAFTLTFGAISLALAIAFGLGGRDAARKLIEDLQKKERKDDLDQL